MELLQQIWNGILQLTSLFVIPDWGSLIALLPIFVLILVIVFFVWALVMYRRTGRKRRRPGRINPAPPAGVHMPGPSYAPFFGAVGVFLLFLGLVFPGPLLLVGAVALILALLFWGREALREYDHVADDHPQLPAVVHEGPPPGVHMPGPSFRPILASIGVFLLFLGLVFPGWILAVGIGFLIVSLLGWLNDAGEEWHRTVEADETGHLENGPAPRWPKVLGLVTVLALVLAVAVTVGWLPPRSTVGGGETGTPGASGAPAGSGAPGGSGAPPGGLTVTAENVKFLETTLSAPADKPFQIQFDNKDAGTPHDVDILDASGAKAFDGAVVTGPAQKTYDVPALKAGTYKFECSIHPALMNGQLTVGG
jgi:cupredoxin-like protein